MLDLLLPFISSSSASSTRPAIIDGGSIRPFRIDKDRLTGLLCVSKQRLSTLVNLVEQNSLLFVYEICFFLCQATLFQTPYDTLYISRQKGN